MTLNYSTPVVNPRLGASFAIFASSYLCLVLMLVILEQLGLSRASISQLIIVTPALFYIAIGFMTRTISLDDFFLSGQRVPALYNGIALTVMVFGGSILLGSIGAIFLAGFDAVAIPLGCLGGIALMAVLFAPYLRKAGAYTLPGFFALRFGGSSIRALASLLAILPCAMIFAAELSLGAQIASKFLPSPSVIGVEIPSEMFFPALAFGAIFLTVFFGGMRSLTWTQCAQFIVVLGILVPVVVVSLLRTNLPLPQLTYGGQIELLKVEEAAKGLNAIRPQTLSESLPETGPQPLATPSDRAFVSFFPAQFLMLVLCIAAGIAAHPAFVTRLSTTPSIPAVRKSFRWAMILAALMVLTLPAYAIFTKSMMVADLMGTTAAQIPSWARALQQLGFMAVTSNPFDPLSGPARLAFERDEVAFVLPVASELPHVVLGLTAASGIAAVAACAGGQLVAIANTVSDDLYHGRLHKSASPARRLMVSRFTMLGVGLLAIGVVNDMGADPLRLVLWGFSISGATFFAVLVLSIWWQRLSAAGAAMGMLAGFMTATGYIFFSGTEPMLFGVDSLTAAAIGIPLSFATAVAVSIVLPSRDPLPLERVEELRVPAGETLHVRALRVGLRGKAAR